MLKRGDLALYKCPCHDHVDSSSGHICLVLEGPLRMSYGSAVGFRVLMEGTVEFFLESELDLVNDNGKGAEV
jgi:hypothetical protein